MIDAPPEKVVQEAEQKGFVGATILPATQATTAPKKLTVQFLCEQNVNYLTDKAPEAPVLLQMMQNQSFVPFLRKGIVGQLVGAGGIGKTHWFMQLALSIATGTEFLGTYRICEPGSVFMGLGENADDDIHRLFNKHEKKLTLEQKVLASRRISVMSFTGQNSAFIRTDGTATDIYNDLLDALKDREPETGWSLIILDPISRFFGADVEKDNAAATNFIALLENMTLKLKGKPTLLFGHHMTKSGVSSTNTDQSSSRGSSAITDGVRWQANLEKVDTKDKDKKFDPNKVCFKVVKSNFTVIPEPLMLQKESNGCLIKCYEENGVTTITQKAKTTCTNQYI